jgi:hypothetical protein
MWGILDDIWSWKEKGMNREIRWPPRPRISMRWLVVLIVIFVLMVAVV